MAKVLSLRSFGMRLKKEADYQVSRLIVPEDVPEELAEKFIRVLRAKSMDEIKDISDMDICSLVNYGEELSSVIGWNTILSGNSGFFDRLQQTKSVTGRRVL